MEQQPIIESSRITILCLCGYSPIVLTPTSKLYQDAVCPQCHRVYDYEITLTWKERTDVAD